MIDSPSLAANPRTVELISVRDGHRQGFVDDGASVTPDGTFPLGMRQNLLRQLAKKYKPYGKAGPEVACWILADDGSIDQSSGDPAKDPARVGQRARSPLPGGSKHTVYGELIDANLDELERKAPLERASIMGEARAQGAKEEFLTHLEKIVDKLGQRIDDRVDAALAPKPTPAPTPTAPAVAQAGGKPK